MPDNNKNPNEKQPGERPEGPEGTYHFNPGNQSGKSEAVPKDQPERVNKKDAIETRKKPARD